jgi:hypothetical protein
MKRERKPFVWRGRIKVEAGYWVFSPDLNVVQGGRYTVREDGPPCRHEFAWRHSMDHCEDCGQWRRLNCVQDDGRWVWSRWRRPRRG